MSHPGNFMDDRDSGIDRNADAIVAGLECVPGRTMLLLELNGGASTPLLPTSFTQAVNAMQAGTPIDVEGNSGKLNFDFDGGAPPSRYELWKVEPDGGFSTTIVEPTGV